MSESLRTLVLQTQDIVAQIAENDGLLTPEMESALAVIDTKMPAKIDSYAAIIERLEVEEEYWKAKADMFLKVAKGCANTQKRMKDTIKEAMTNLGLVDLHGVDVRFKLSVSKPKLVINEDMLDSDFKTEVTTWKPNKELIEEKLKEGMQIDGVEMIETKSLRTYANTKAGK